MLSYWRMISIWSYDCRSFCCVYHWDFKVHKAMLSERRWNCKMEKRIQFNMAHPPQCCRPNCVHARETEVHSTVCIKQAFCGNALLLKEMSCDLELPTLCLLQEHPSSLTPCGALRVAIPVLIFWSCLFHLLEISELAAWEGKMSPHLQLRQHLSTVNSTTWHQTHWPLMES